MLISRSLMRAAFFKDLSHTAPKMTGVPIKLGQAGDAEPPNKGCLTRINRSEMQ